MAIFSNPHLSNYKLVSIPNPPWISSNCTVKIVWQVWGTIINGWVDMIWLAIRTIRCGEASFWQGSRGPLSMVELIWGTIRTIRCREASIWLGMRGPLSMLELIWRALRTIRCGEASIWLGIPWKPGTWSTASSSICSSSSPLSLQSLEVRRRRGHVLCLGQTCEHFDNFPHQRSSFRVTTKT